MDVAIIDISELSRGQEQKAPFVGALAQDPSVLLLDKPTSNQGIKHQMKVTEIIREMAMNREISVIMAARNINLAFKYTDRSRRLCSRSNPVNLSQSAIMGA